MVSTGPSACSERGPESWQLGKSTSAATVELHILEHCPGAPRRDAKSPSTQPLFHMLSSVIDYRPKAQHVNFVFRLHLLWRAVPMGVVSGG